LGWVLFIGLAIMLILLLKQRQNNPPGPAPPAGRRGLRRPDRRQRLGRPLRAAWEAFTHVRETPATFMLFTSQYSMNILP
jgi:hypothetical protein